MKDSGLSPEDINLILNLEKELRLLQKIVEFMLNKNETLVKPTQNVINTFEQQTVAELQEKYPHLLLSVNNSSEPSIGDDITKSYDID